ncbi:MAG: S1 RNA-binding domain-containing protein, partial [Ilumatobacteraceae bacterium]
MVVDGSNIATEGRSFPSLAQLNEAVTAFMAEHPDVLVTVVVDATFGHRIDPKEQAEFDEAISNNELVAPPAGAVGRGDAFVLSIAKKVNATILTNDSYQEFHGEVDWLFDEGRLIGGKPVPHVGWVFVPRLPVRGPVSRSAMKEAKRKRGTKAAASRPSAAASQPMPVPKAPPPNVRPAGARTAQGKSERRTSSPPPAAAAVAAAAGPSSTTAVNDLLPFITFVELHPVGSSVNAVVESYSSHGAYVRIGDVKAYVPLRLMADPPPRSARELMKIGDAVTLVVESFAPARRSIDLAVAGMSTAKPVEAPPKKTRAAKRSSRPAEVEGTEAPV